METDWLALWRELVNMNTSSSNTSLVSRYKAHVGKKKQRPDDLLNFVLEKIDNKDTVLDIGAGGGRWTIPIAATAGNVTAVEPSADMRAILCENINEAGMDNIDTVPSTWEEAAVEPHDVVVSAHAIYGSYHDSPNAIIAYNALYSIGIFANVLVENSIHCWVNDTVEEAVARAKRHLHLEAASGYDGLMGTSKNPPFGRAPRT